MIYLARHGQTESNLSHTWQGQSGNDGLNNTGQMQASKLGDFLKSKNIQKIFNSPLKRASQTAGIISKIIGIQSVEEPLLMEMSYGKFEGLDIDQVKQNYGDLYENWKTTPADTQFPEGESFEDLLKRAEEVVRKYFYKSEDVLLVSHEDCIRGIITAVTKKSEDFWKPEITNTSVTTFEKVNGSIKILSIGETKHMSI